MLWLVFEPRPIFSCSPVRLLVTDPLGRRAGLDLTTGQTINEIPGAFVSEEGVDPQLIIVPEITGEYQVDGVGVAQGDYKLIALQDLANPVLERYLTGQAEVGQPYQFTVGLPLPQESGGQIVMEAEQFMYQIGRNNRTWQTQTVLTGYSDPGYLSALPDTDQTFTSAYTTTSPEVRYTANFTTTGTYYVWLRGYAPNGAGDSVHVRLGDQPAAILTGFTPRSWSWANIANDGNPVTIEIIQPGLYTLHLWQREDGLHLDRILLTTDSNYTPSGTGP